MPGSIPGEDKATAKNAAMMPKPPGESCPYHRQTTADGRNKKGTKRAHIFRIT